MNKPELEARVTELEQLLADKESAYSQAGSAIEELQATVKASESKRAKETSAMKAEIDTLSKQLTQAKSAGGQRMSSPDHMEKIRRIKES